MANDINLLFNVIINKDPSYPLSFVINLNMRQNSQLKYYSVLIRHSNSETIFQFQIIFRFLQVNIN